MGKKMKIAYFAVIALNLIACVVNVIRGDYSSVILSGISVLWLCVCYGLSAQIDKAHALLAESLTREKIAIQELQKMRERAQEAEKKYKQLIDDTPTRDKRGRYAKR